MQPAARGSRDSEMFDLTGKTALVTGAASGIGEAIARTFVTAGAFVMVADKDRAGGERVVADLRQANGEAAFALVDVTSEADCAAVATRVEQERGRVDVLVNNAGIGHVGRLDSTEGADLDRLY